MPAGEGTKGPRLHDLAYRELADLEAAEYDGERVGLWTRGLLVQKIGVASLGHRRKILRAIAELASAPAEIAAMPVTRLVEPAPNSENSVAAPQDPQAGTNGDRRYLNVMFCDLVGSTGISAQLDAEEWRDLVSSYLDATSAAATDIGGRVLKKLQTRPERKAA
jgi:class 3 adenylate cyclase